MSSTHALPLAVLANRQNCSKAEAPPSVFILCATTYKPSTNKGYPKAREGKANVRYHLSKERGGEGERREKMMHNGDALLLWHSISMGNYQFWETIPITPRLVLDYLVSYH